jgi:hypothetical protein
MGAHVVVAPSSTIHRAVAPHLFYRLAPRLPSAMPSPALAYLLTRKALRRRIFPAFLLFSRTAASALGGVSRVAACKSAFTPVVSNVLAFRSTASWTVQYR